MRAHVHRSVVWLHHEADLIDRASAPEPAQTRLDTHQKRPLTSTAGKKPRITRESHHEHS
jgi:hypothetical protein